MKNIADIMKESDANKVYKLLTARKKPFAVCLYLWAACRKPFAVRLKSYAARPKPRQECMIMHMCR